MAKEGKEKNTSNDFNTIKIHARFSHSVTVLNDVNGAEIVLDIKKDKGKIITKSQLMSLIEEREETLTCGNLYFEKDDLEKVIEVSDGIIDEKKAIKLISNKELDKIVKKGFDEFEKIMKEVNDNEFFLNYIHMRQQEDRSYGNNQISDYLNERLMVNRYAKMKNEERMRRQ